MNFLSDSTATRSMFPCTAHTCLLIGRPMKKCEMEMFLLTQGRNPTTDRGGILHTQVMVTPSCAVLSLVRIALSGTPPRVM